MNLRSRLTFFFIFLVFTMPFSIFGQNTEGEAERVIPRLKLGNDADEDDYISIGGALRFNYNYSNWLENSKKEGGEFGYDAFWLETEGQYKGLTFNAQYRIYAENSGGGMLKQGWIGYKFDDQHEIQVGQNIIPFGPLPYNSHNWFFNITYYLGFEDNSDMGIKYIYDTGKWELDLAFYKNSDMLDFFDDEGITGNHRYAYDVGGRNKEVNKGSFRLVRHFDGKEAHHELGISGQLGGLYNLDTKKMGSHNTFGMHYVLDYKHWNLITEAIIYNKTPKDADKIQDPNAEGGQMIENPQYHSGMVKMGAYGALYDVATKGAVYAFSPSYNISVNEGILDDITVYTDLGWLHKRQSGFKDSYQIIPGIMLTTGPIFTYIDYAMGKNHPWMGKDFDGLGKGESGTWGSRFNINIGYYF